jgi:hypothetical protein
MEERIAYALLQHPTFRKAFVDEGMNPELSVGNVLRRVKEREQAGKAKESERLTRSKGRGHKERSRL